MAEQRQRAERQQEETTQRRRRRDETFESHGSMKMKIPDEVQAKLKAEGRTPRWVNDEPGRIERLTTKDDFDRVEGVEPVRVGSTDDGKPLLAYLLSKPDEFIREDQQVRERNRAKVEQAMVRGSVPTAPGQDPAPVQGAAPGSEIYVPEGNAIGREKARIIE